MGKDSGRAMSDAHKKAMAVGRDQGRAVKAYLTALAEHKPKRGRKRTRESIENRLAMIADQYDSVDAFKRLAFAQERIDLEAELAAMDAPATSIADLEAEFVKVAKDYSASKGLTRAAWREVGVEPRVLDKAGIK